MGKKIKHKKIEDAVIKNIQQELISLEDICLQIGRLIEKAEEEKETSTFLNRAAGSMLHDFYTGVEKIFFSISSKMDKDLPVGPDWHIKLLNSMAVAKGRRPPVISSLILEELKKYLGFRHLFRNIYGSQLDWDKMKILLLKIQDGIWEELKLSLNSFMKKIRYNAKKK